MKIKLGQHVSAVGMTGAGKTFFVKNSLLPAWDRIIVVDTEEYDFNEFPKVSVKAALKLAKSNYRFAVRVVLSGDRSMDAEPLRELCMGLLTEGHDLVIYFDEVTDFADANQIPPPMRSLIRKGRKRRLNVIVGTQRVAMLSKDYFANCVHRFYFFVEDANTPTVKMYAPWLEARVDEIPHESYTCFYQYAGNVQKLGPAVEYDWKERLKHK